MRVSDAVLSQIHKVLTAHSLRCPARAHGRRTAVATRVLCSGILIQPIVSWNFKFYSERSPPSFGPVRAALGAASRAGEVSGPLLLFTFLSNLRGHEIRPFASLGSLNAEASGTSVWDSRSLAAGTWLAGDPASSLHLPGHASLGGKQVAQKHAC